MKLDNRDKHEAEFQRRISRLWLSRQRELRDLLASGKPVPQSFWDSVQRDTENELMIVLMLLWMTSSDQSGMGDDIAEDLSGDWVKRRAKAVADSVTSTSRKILTAKTDAADDDSDLSDSEIDDAMSSIWTPSRMKILAKTETTAVHSGATIAAGEWFGEHDRKRFPNGTELIWTLGPCLHCVLPGQHALPIGRLVGASKGFHDGPAIKLTFASGRNLSVTPNHPILTPRGLVAAKELRKGMKVTSAADFERMLDSCSPDNNDRPALIENVFGSFNVAGGVVSARMPTAAEDFHGDGVFRNGDVDVVVANGKLRNYDGAIREHFINELGKENLVLSNLRQIGMFGSGATTGRRFSDGTSSNPVFSGHVGGNQRLGLRQQSHVNAARSEYAVQDFSSHASGLRQLIQWHTGNVVRNQLVCPVHDIGIGIADPFRDFRPLGDGHPRPHQTSRLPASSHYDPSILQDVLDGSRGSPESHREFTVTRSTEVGTDEVVDVEVFSYSGHVYNLSCESQHLFIAEGIVVGNCDFCPFMEGTEKEVWSLFIPGGPPAHVNCCCWLNVVPSFASPGRRPPAHLVRQIMADMGIIPWP